VIQVRVSRKGADRIASGHPWIFAADVENRAAAQAGDVVEVVDIKGRRFGSAHYSSTSQITLRMLDRGSAAIDADFFRARIEAAEKYRKRVVRDSNTYRLVHSEGDRLPGLIIDRYADCFSVQFLSQGMDRAKDVIADVLEEMFHPLAIVARNDASVREKEGLPRVIEVMRGELPQPLRVAMNGFTLGADLVGGQKTGIFLDQRENYLAAASHGFGHALDCFTSTGGFALHLSRVCESVEAVDSSEAAISTVRGNLAGNNITNVTAREADVFDLLPTYAAAKKKFDTIVLDPPAFAKSRTAVEGALRGYREINQRALRLLNPGGVLVTCSCSHLVSEVALLEVIGQAALDTGKTLRVLERRVQAADHPILLAVPETMYLKCIILQSV
jgi:23S rRNA (cytosine1962-C5)-methyltransferase